MSQLRGYGNKGKTDTEESVTTTSTATKTALDVNIISDSGESPLSSGSITHGLSYMSVVKSETATEDVYSFYSDSGSTTLVSTVTITYTDSTKKNLSSAVRVDV